MPTTVRSEPTMVVGGYPVDGYTLDQQQVATLKKLVTRVNRFLGKQVAGSARIEATGHTDFTGSEAYNVGLGQRRSDNVIEFIESALDSSVKPRVQSVALSAGESQPVAKDPSRQSRARNRRVEIALEWVLPAQKKKPKPKPKAPERVQPKQRIKDRPTRDCLDYQEQLRRFGAIRIKLENTRLSTYLYWAGEGSKITLGVKDQRTFFKEITTAVTDQLSAQVKDPLKERILGKRLAVRLGAWVSALETFSSLSQDAENRRLMNYADRSMDDARYEKHRWLVCLVVAEELAADLAKRGRRADKVKVALWLSNQWDQIERLQEKCDRSRGIRRRQPEIRPAPKRVR